MHYSSDDTNVMEKPFKRCITLVFKRCAVNVCCVAVGGGALYIRPFGGFLYNTGDLSAKFFNLSHVTGDRGDGIKYNVNLI